MQQFASRCLAEATAPEVLDYVGVAQANLAWLAWHRGSPEEALRKGQEALACWDRTPTGYGFRWLALWSLVVVATSRDGVAEAIGYARSLTDPSQQALPLPLVTVLEEAIQAGEQGRVEDARGHLSRATELAGEMGYL